MYLFIRQPDRVSLHVCGSGCVCKGERNKDKHVLDREKAKGVAPSGRQPQQ